MSTDRIVAVACKGKDLSFALDCALAEEKRKRAHEYVDFYTRSENREPVPFALTEKAERELEARRG
jgi:hypothetical protein